MSVAQGDLLGKFAMYLFIEFLIALYLCRANTGCQKKQTTKQHQPSIPAPRKTLILAMRHPLRTMNAWIPPQAIITRPLFLSIILVYFFVDTIREKGVRLSSGPLEPCHLKRLLFHLAYHGLSIPTIWNPRLANILVLFAPATGLGQSDNRPSSSSSHAAGLTLNLSSNNPFRNRAASPNNFSPPPHSPFDDPPARPVSRNPFLDPLNQPPTQRTASPDKMASSRDTTSPSAEELFVSYHFARPRRNLMLADILLTSI